MRRIYEYTILALLVLSAGIAQAAPGVQIIHETAAARHGLTRPWFTQAQVDRTRGKIQSIVLFDDTLFVQTDRAVLQALDAATGSTLWVKEVGRRNFPSMRPSANGDMVAVINGSTLYVLDRRTGRLLWQREVEGVPGAGPALSQQRVFVPMTDGIVLAYRLEAVTDPAVEMGLLDPKSEDDAKKLEARRLENLRLQQDLKPPLACQSFGRAMVQPLVTRETKGEEYVVWPTDRGYLFAGRINRKDEDYFEMVYKLETAADITARPTLLPAASEEASDSAIIFAPSQDGFLHAIREQSGTSMWRFSTGEPVVKPAAPISDKVYVTTQLGGMYCLAVQTGQQLWWAPGIMKFLAASKDRVYAEDTKGDIVVLHAQSGGRLDVIPAAGLAIKMMNLQNDRLFLAADSGLVQCLHEIELEQPILHRPKPAPKVEEPKAKPETPAKTEQPKPAAGDPSNPFGGAAPAADNPFGGAAPAADNPFGGAAPAADDPFGGMGTGGRAAPAADPFGNSTPADDPFGGGGNKSAPADDPFGGGGNKSAPVEDPFG